MKIIVEWEVEDGYAGKSRPQKTEIDTEDYFDNEEWNEMTDDEKKEHLESFVQEDFEQKISFGITDWGL